MEEIKKVNIIGKHYYHVFEDIETKETCKIECSAEEYFALGQPNPPEVKAQEGFKWIYSFEDNKYDTTDGFLENNTYAKESDEVIVAKDAEGNFRNINIEVAKKEVDFLTKILSKVE